MEVAISTIVRTLLGSRFQVVESSRKPGYIAFSARRHDEFGVEWRYLIAYSGEGNLSVADVGALQQVARASNASLVIVSDGEKKVPAPTEVPVFNTGEFTARLGGVIDTFLPLEDTYAERLEELGRNKVPSGLAGRADDLFEAYVFAGLRFVLGRRVVRYGQERTFEVVPDGIALGLDSFNLMGIAQISSVTAKECLYTSLNRGTADALIA